MNRKYMVMCLCSGYDTNGNHVDRCEYEWFEYRISDDSSEIVKRLREDPNMINYVKKNPGDRAIFEPFPMAPGSDSIYYGVSRQCRKEFDKLMLELQQEFFKKIGSKPKGLFSR